MASRAKVVINQLKWENKLLQREVKEMQNMRDINYRNCEKEDEVKEVDQHNSLKVKDWLGTNEMNELKELKTSFKLNNFGLKCTALFCVFLCFVIFVLMLM